MNQELTQKLQYSFAGQKVAYSLPFPLKESLQLISDFFRNNTNHKLCLVFPTKDFVAQWLSIPSALFLIQSDFDLFKNEIIESLEKYKKGDCIILNNEAVVEWVGRNANGFIFKHKEYNGVDEITINIKKISKIQPAPSTRKVLSGYKRVIEALSKTNDDPIDKILGIQTEGNQLYQKNSICLVSKHISFENSISEILLNNYLIAEYFKPGRINDSGEIETKSPLLISNNLRNLALYVTLSNTVSKIVIDGYSTIQERRVDFNDIDAMKIPTILITDLSEVENIENIGNFGFDFFNFTKENLKFYEMNELSPFSSFNRKLERYVRFNLIKVICKNAELERIVKLIHTIENDESVRELIDLKILLIQLTNLVSRIAHPLNQQEADAYREKFKRVESLFCEYRFYLGSSSKAIEESISLLKLVVENFANSPSQKNSQLNELLSAVRYDYIICQNDDEAMSLSSYLNNTIQSIHKPKVISVANVTNSLLEFRPAKAILTGWVKSNNVNRLLSSFIFYELTVLFYQFEIGYFDSLQKRNKQLVSNANPTITKTGIPTKSGGESNNGFSDFYKNDSSGENNANSNFDVVEFELKLDNAQYSKYILKGNLNESVKAKRVEFRMDKFIYMTDTHGLLVLENFYQSSSKSLNIHKSRVETLYPGDIIAFLKTERELLNKIVEKNTTPSALAQTTRWIQLWKHLLKNHYKLLNNDFNKLVCELKAKGCSRDPATIRSWLFDDLRIGPRKDDDLIAIAIMANGMELYNNLKEVRAAIKQMTSWRMKASDFVIEQLKLRIKKSYSEIQVNSSIDFEDLGEVEILEITEIKNTPDIIDIRNANRLLEKTQNIWQN